MTIVSGPDHRNADWANDTSSFGQKMLLKMGWKQGNGLGKNQQGTSTNLRAVRREENLGIGAKTDLLGDEGFSVTSRNFHGVLATLQAEYGDSSKSSSSRDKRKEKKSEGKTNSSKKALDRKDSGLTLSSNRVTAGHAKKMRDAKDLTTKSKEDMAAIFGMKVEQYQSNSIWGRMSTLSSFCEESSTDEQEEVNKNLQEQSNVDTRGKKEKKKKSKKSSKTSKSKRKTKDEDYPGKEKVVAPVTTTAEEEANDAKPKKKKRRKET
jgi:Pin2-interacting protein X1